MSKSRVLSRASPSASSHRSWTAWISRSPASTFYIIAFVLALSEVVPIVMSHSEFAETRRTKSRSRVVSCGIDPSDALCNSGVHNVLSGLSLYGDVPSPGPLP